jgi:hypothetical protein
MAPSPRVSPAFHLPLLKKPSSSCLSYGPLPQSIKLTLHALVEVKPIAREDAALHIVAFRIPVIHIRRSQVPTILGVLYEAATQRKMILP